MDKRSLIAVAICFLILLVYPYFMKWVYPPSPQKQSVEHSVEQTPAQEIPVPQERRVGANAPESAIVPAFKTPEQEFVVENDSMRVVLSNWGGSIKEIGMKFFHDKAGETLRLGPGSKDGWKIFDLYGLPGGQDNTAYKGTIEGRKVVFESMGEAPLLIRKTYAFSEAGYQIAMTVELINRSQADIVLNQGFSATVGSIYPHEEKEGVADVSIAALDNLGNVWRKTAAKVKTKSEQAGSFRWAGVQNQYYALILRPDTEARSLSYAPLLNSAGKVQGCEAALWLGKFNVPADTSHEEKFSLYAGPKQYFQMKEMPGDYQQIIDFGMFSPICKAILYSLHFLYKYCRNYGIAIILLTVLIKILTYPLTAQSFKSMKRMQAIQPHIQALKEKLKDNPKKMQKEMMELYKEHKVNPMGGCLPMLIQLPIFVALFSTLRTAIELKGSSFLWVKDLSLPDTVAHVAGLPINILPIIMGGTMVWQQKMSTVDPQQQKLMMLMPVFFTFIFYSFPSGLVLYWLVNNILSIAQQYQVQRQK